MALIKNILLVYIISIRGVSDALHIIRTGWLDSTYFPEVSADIHMGSIESTIPYIGFPKK